MMKHKDSISNLKQEKSKQQLQLVSQLLLIQSCNASGHHNDVTASITTASSVNASTAVPLPQIEFRLFPFCGGFVFFLQIHENVGLGKLNSQLISYILIFLTVRCSGYIKLEVKNCHL